MAGPAALLPAHCLLPAVCRRQLRMHLSCHLSHTPSPHRPYLAVLLAVRGRPRQLGSPLALVEQRLNLAVDEQPLLRRFAKVRGGCVQPGCLTSLGCYSHQRLSLQHAAPTLPVTAVVSLLPQLLLLCATSHTHLAVDPHKDDSPARVDAQAAEAAGGGPVVRCRRAGVSDGLKQACRVRMLGACEAGLTHLSTIAALLRHQCAMYFWEGEK